MKYEKFAIKTGNGLYIKYPTAYRYKSEFTKNLYDAHLWDIRDEALKLANFLMQDNNSLKLSVVEV